MGLFKWINKLAFISNWGRLGGIHGIIVMFVYRIGNIIYYKVNVPILKQVLWILYRMIDLLIIRLFMNCEFPAQSQIGKKLHLPHGAKGIIINPFTKIGDHVTILHQVTFGQSKEIRKAPEVCDYAYIGVGAKILGGIRIGTNSKVGANAVVLTSVPDNCTAVGVPSVIKGKQKETVIK
ncbi:serine O-acetyltransferase [Peribacillus sp. NPDC101480]|uniref:serine O-acetyltransferase n=1 Tax=Peribacillus sp. NPDC101480 TaxID=3390620 RepID=UPI003D0666F3